MCTVTYIPAKDKIFLTSNRDEHSSRLIALPPKIFSNHDISLLYPVDGNAGGTWIAVNNAGVAAVLLNGAFEPHTPHPPYRHSRGLLLPLALSSRDAASFLSHYDCTNIEPFTIVLHSNQQLLEYRWDGAIKHQQTLDSRQRHIWSSATLYPPDIIEERKIWFDDWSAQHPMPNQEQIIHFHTYTGKGDQRNDLLMKRENLQTVSITSIMTDGRQAAMQYTDVCQHATDHQLLPILQTLAECTLGN